MCIQYEYRRLLRRTRRGFGCARGLARDDDDDDDDVMGVGALLRRVLGGPTVKTTKTTTTTSGGGGGGSLGRRRRRKVDDEDDDVDADYDDDEDDESMIENEDDEDDDDEDDEDDEDDDEDDEDDDEVSAEDGKGGRGRERNRRDDALAKRGSKRVKKGTTEGESRGGFRVNQNVIDLAPTSEKGDDDDDDAGELDRRGGGRQSRRKPAQNLRQMFGTTTTTTTSMKTGRDIEGANAQRAKKSPGGGNRRAAKVDIVDLEMAIELSLDVDTLTEIERSFLPETEEHTDADFIAIRNALIVKWRSKPREYLSAAAATTLFKNKFFTLARCVHKYLTTFGYINFGVMKSGKFEAELTEGDKMSVVVVGAGIAGVTAARHLQALGHKVVVIESRERSGGRIRTQEFENTSASSASGRNAVADLGGSILSGKSGNPLCVVAKQLGIKTQTIQPECPLFDKEGELIDETIDAQVEKDFNEILAQMSRYRDSLTVDAAAKKSFGQELSRRINSVLRDGVPVGSLMSKTQTFDWHVANLEFANAARADDLSLRYWDQDDPYDFTGEHVVIPGGNSRFVEALAKDVKIWYQHRVTGITDASTFGSTGVIVHCGDAIDICADCCIVTVPLGVLKKDVISFVPALPPRKMQAIRNINFGLLNKVVLVFEHRFWDENIDTFGFLQNVSKDRGKFFLVYSYTKHADGNVLLALCSGDSAIEVENSKVGDVVDDLMESLRSAFEKNGVVIPDPLAAHVTAWGKDENTYGSYSSCSTTTSTVDYEEMSKPVNNVHFAGEATNAMYPATIHGAFLSGLREAGRIAMKSAATDTNKKMIEINVAINSFEADDSDGA